MKAARIHAYEGPNAVRVDRVEVFEPGPGEVRIQVAAAGMNNSDLQATYGRYGGYGYSGLPHTLGQEAAGWVDAIGPGLTEFEPGVRVVGHVKGGFGEMAIAPAAELLLLPDDISFEVAASLPIAYLTASMALIHKANVEAGEWVLVNPGSGGVGTAAIQLAKLLGANVIATAGTAVKAAYLQELGADLAIDRSIEDVLTEVRQIVGDAGVEVALDGGGNVTLAECVQCIANEGRIVSYGYTTGMEATLPLGTAIGRNITFYCMALWYNRDYPATLKTLGNLVLPAVADGKLRPTIDRVVDLDGVSDALAQMEKRCLKGKVVVVPRV